LSVTDDKIKQTIGALKRIYSAVEIAQTIVDEAQGEAQPEAGFVKTLAGFDSKIKKALNDDFNTAEFISYVFEATRAFNALKIATKRKPVHKATAQAFIDWITKYGKMSALFADNPETILNELDQLLLNERGVERSKVEELIKKRNEARENKDWAAADEVKKELTELGIEVHDGTKRSWSVAIN
jgi:cysteinyl-tRNA synthetase